MLKEKELTPASPAKERHVGYGWGEYIFIAVTV